MVFIKKINVCILDYIECYLEINDEQKKQRIMSRRNIKVEQKKKKDDLVK